jgi:hypothetical protein
VDAPVEPRAGYRDDGGARSHCRIFRRPGSGRLPSYIVKQQRGEAGLTARYPWIVAFTFGLVHGIGFAGALAGLGLERRLLPAALLFFNIGVEIGQLAFVLLVLALIWAHRRLDAVVPRWGEAVPAYLIGSVSMFWFFGRLARVFAAI